MSACSWSGIPISTSLTGCGSPTTVANEPAGFGVVVVPDDSDLDRLVVSNRPHVIFTFG